MDFWVRQQLRKFKTICCSFGKPVKLLLLDSATTNPGKDNIAHFCRAVELDYLINLQPNVKNATVLYCI